LTQAFVIAADALHYVSRFTLGSVNWPSMVSLADREIGIETAHEWRDPRNRHLIPEITFTWLAAQPGQP